MFHDKGGAICKLINEWINEFRIYTKFSKWKSKYKKMNALKKNTYQVCIILTAFFFCMHSIIMYFIFPQIHFLYGNKFGAPFFKYMVCTLHVNACNQFTFFPATLPQSFIYSLCKTKLLFSRWDIWKFVIASQDNCRPTKSVFTLEPASTDIANIWIKPILSVSVSEHAYSKISFCGSAKMYFFLWH